MEIDKTCETEWKWNTTNQNLWTVAKAMLGGKFIIYTPIPEKKKGLNNLSFYNGEIRKKKKKKSKPSPKQEMR